MIEFVYPPDPHVIPVDTTFKVEKPLTLQETAQALRHMVVDCKYDEAFVKHALLSFPATRAGASVFTGIDPPQEFLKATSSKESAALYYAGLDYKTQLNRMAHTLNQHCTTWASRAADAYGQLRSIEAERKRLFNTLKADWRQEVQALNESLPAKSPLRQALFKYTQRRQACETQFGMLKVKLPEPEKCVFQLPPEISGNAKALCVWMRDACERMAQDAIQTIYTVHVHALCNLLIAADAAHIVS